MRTFIALELPETFIADTAAFARRLAASAKGRFCARTTYHLTLAFLGETDEAKVIVATKALETVCFQAKPFLLQSDGLGTFGCPAQRTISENCHTLHIDEFGFTE